MSRWVLRALGGLASFSIALAISGVGGCNLHELGHLVTGWAAGVPIDDIIWCTPTSGRIAFAYQEPAFVGYAGGFLAASVLLVVYLALIRKRLASFPWWMAGVAVLGTAISQLIVAAFEGSSPLVYAQLIDNQAGLAAVAIAPLIAAGVLQAIARPVRFGPISQNDLSNSEDHD
jgi:hypothetical protein